VRVWLRRDTLRSLSSVNASGGVYKRRELQYRAFTGVSDLRSVMPAFFGSEVMGCVFAGEDPADTSVSIFYHPEAGSIPADGETRRRFALERQRRGAGLKRRH
jgi:hypothetical protein